MRLYFKCGFSFMIVRSLFLLLLMCNLVGGAVPLAYADLGQINLVMRATLVSNACAVSIKSSNQTVNLGTWATRQFVATPIVTPPVRFIITLQDCGPATSGVQVQFNGTASASDSTLYALNPGSTASGLGVAVLDRFLHRIPSSYITPVYPLSPPATNFDLIFYAQYVALPGMRVSAGSANADVTFTMWYL